LPTRAPLRSPGEAYPRGIREVELTHAIRPESEEPLARRGGVRDERSDVDRLARRREGAQPLDAFLEKNRRAMKVPMAPMVEAHPDLEDAVIQTAHRCGGVAPQQLDRLVLLEELAGIELLDAAKERFRWRF
jgi:hypothetical protein